MRRSGLAAIFLVVAVLLSPSLGLAGDVMRYVDNKDWPDWAAVYYRTMLGERMLPDDGELVEAIKWELIRGYPYAYLDGAKKYSDREFRANAAMSRAEFAAVLSRSQGLGSVDGAGAEWFKPYVEVLQARGIIPVDASTDWSNPITRREAGQWMGRAADAFKADDLADTPSFVDVNDPLIERALRAGIVKGTGGGRFEPDRSLLRIEAAVMLVRLARARNSAGNAKNPEVLAELTHVVKEADRQHTERMKHWVDLGYIDEVETNGIISRELADWMYFNAQEDLDYKGGPPVAWSVRPDEFYKVEVLEVHDTVAILEISGRDHLYRKSDPEGTPQFDWPFKERQYLVLIDGQWVVTGFGDPVNR